MFSFRMLLLHKFIMMYKITVCKKKIPHLVWWWGFYQRATLPRNFSWQI